MRKRSRDNEDLIVFGKPKPNGTSVGDFVGTLGDDVLVVESCGGTGGVSTLGHGAGVTGEGVETGEGRRRGGTCGSGIDGGEGVF